MAKKSVPAPTAVVGIDADPLLPRVEAARLVGLSAATMRDLACRGEGPRFVKRGTSQQGRCFYRRSDLERWLSSCSRIVGN